MKFNFIKIPLIAFGLFFTTSSSITIKNDNGIYELVFICDSKGGKKYHFSKTCRGLSACKSAIKSLSVSDAKRIGKTLCGWED